MKKSIFLSIAIALAASCSFLEEDSKVLIDEPEAFETTENLEAQVYGIVAAFDQSALFTQQMQEYLHSASGLIIWKGQRLSDQWLDGLYLAKYSTNNTNINRFAQLYTGINRCNRLLDGLGASPVEDSFKKEIEGEAKFYRAIFYYTLARLYGDTPLILSAARHLSETSVPRTAYYKVYAQIISDFGDAESMMRTPGRVEELTPGKGRPNRWAATAFKSSVYMTIGSMLSSFEQHPDDQFFDPTKDDVLIAEGKDPRTPDFSTIGIHNAADAWKLAYDTAEKVISEGPYSLVGDYRKLFRWTDGDDWNLPERIFTIQSTVSVNSGNKLALYSLPQFCEGTSQTSIENNNWGRYRPSRFFFQKFASDNGGVHGTSTTGTDNNIYVSCPDPRFDATFIHTSYINLNTGKKQAIYPTYNRIYETSSTNAYPYFKKYRDPRFNVNTGYADFYFMRLAEVYLISAEAAASLSQTHGDTWWNKALSRVEDIHKRARNSTDGLPAAYPSWAARDFSDSEELINAIMWERMYELGGEGHEYFDTHRRGARWLIKEIAQPLNAHLQAPEQGPKGDVVGVWEYTYMRRLMPTTVYDARKSLMCGFPLTESTYNTAIDIVKDQNDFYWQ